MGGGVNHTVGGEPVRLHEEDSCCLQPGQHFSLHMYFHAAEPGTSCVQGESNDEGILLKQDLMRCGTHFSAFMNGSVVSFPKMK